MGLLKSCARKCFGENKIIQLLFNSVLKHIILLFLRYIVLNESAEQLRSRLFLSLKKMRYIIITTTFSVLHS